MNRFCLGDLYVVKVFRWTRLFRTQFSPLLEKHPRRYVSSLGVAFFQRIPAFKTPLFQLNSFTKENKKNLPNDLSFWLNFSPSHVIENYPVAISSFTLNLFSLPSGCAFLIVGKCKTQWWIYNSLSYIRKLVKTWCVQKQQAQFLSHLFFSMWNKYSCQLRGWLQCSDRSGKLLPDAESLWRFYPYESSLRTFNSVQNLKGWIQDRTNL